MIWTGKTCSGKFRISTCTLNLRWEKDYFFRGESLERFKNNYEMVANNPSDSFFTNVLANRQLKSDFKYGKITKAEFFSTLKGGE